jgi:acetyl-CoA acetyltransferase
MFSAFNGAWDVHDVENISAQWTNMGEGVEVPEGSTSPRPYSVFMDVYAGFSRMHMREFGTTQRQLAAIASKNHGHSTMNPLAQYTKAFTVDEVLNAAPISFPLTVPMCSPISDGAAAAIVCNEAGLRKLNAAKARAMRVLATVIRTGSTREATDLSRHCSRLGAEQAYQQAGLGPEDIDIAEVHDASATGEVIESEALGFCAIGEGGVIAERGDTTLGGRIPINVSGGLESKGHPIGATGLGQIYELVTQLRGEAGKRQVDGARHAMAQNGGGIHGVEEAVSCLTIVGK